LIVSQLTIVAWLVATFLRASAWKCSSTSTNSAETCGPRLTASHISAFVHSFPVFAGHLYVAYSRSISAAGCSRAKPVGHIEFQYCGLSVVPSVS
jgi:hypothetical protein